MNPERLHQIETLYLKASALSQGEREDFLLHACAGDAALRKEIISLLVYEKSAESFMEVDAFQQQIESLADDWKEISTALTGRTLLNRYQVQERIGAGGMGVVYRALDTRLERIIALKVLLPGLTADLERSSRFAREAKAASALQHPNIITIHDIDQADGIDFIAMEFIAGRTLQDIIACRELTTSDALQFALQIAQALMAAHSAGIIHRDIKPANIMITRAPDGTSLAKVLDFGLAKLSEIARLDQTLSEDMTKGSIIGTAAYMSPEQAEGKLIDARSDIFSFGSSLYEMLSCRRAFRGESNLAILMAVLRENPEPLPGIPLKLQNLVMQCLQKDPNLRIQSAVELKAALEDCMALSINTSSPTKTIAVLPFKNFSGDKDNEYFSDGLTEEMISALARLPGLRVTARSSAFALRGTNLDAREIGARLHVEHILEGSVRRSGNRVRVTAQVVNVADGYQLWAERYDREMSDILDIQDDISQAIVETLRVRLVKDLSPVQRHTKNPEAYSMYLRGRYHQEKKTPEGYSKARQYFEQALEVDPNYAMAFLGLAEFYWQSSYYGFQYPKEALAGAKQATIRALELNDSLPEARALLGSLQGIADCDWQAAGASFQRALESDANSPYVLFRYANFYLWPQGRIEEATAAIERTLLIDPLWVLANWALAYYLYAKRQYDLAIRRLHAVIEMEPSFYLAYSVLGLAQIQQGRLEEAVRTLEKACVLCPDNDFTLGMLAYGLGRLGKTEETHKLIEQITATGMNAFMPAKSLMFAYAGLNDAPNTLAWAEQSLGDHDPMAVMLLIQDPVLDFIRPDPRYPALFRKINLRQRSQ